MKTVNAAYLENTIRSAMKFRHASDVAWRRIEIRQTVAALRAERDGTNSRFRRACQIRASN